MQNSKSVVHFLLVDFSWWVIIHGKVGDHPWDGGDHPEDGHHNTKDGHPPAKIDQKEVYYRLGILHLDFTHKIKTR